MKRIQKMTGIILIGLALTGCGEKTVANVDMEDTEQVNLADELIQEETLPHEHTYEYVSNADGSHSILCSGKECDYSENESCTLDDKYECNECGYKHEHDFNFTANNDGTHMSICNECGYEEGAVCTPDETYVCTVCGWVQEHDCVYEHYECGICGEAYPWEQEIDYFDGTFGWSQGIYYAQKELNIYKYPDAESEIIGTLNVDEGVNCVGRVIIKEGSDVSNYWITEDGGCILNGFSNKKNRRDLRVAKTHQVVVTYSTLSGDTWSPAKFHAIYDSYDAALLDLCGSSWSTVKASWQYNDYKSQGQPFMNSYSEGASGKTVSTQNLVDPYSYTAGGNIDYRFE